MHLPPHFIIRSGSGRHSAVASQLPNQYLVGTTNQEEAPSGGRKGKYDIGRDPALVSAGGALRFTAAGSGARATAMVRRLYCNSAIPAHPIESDLLPDRRFSKG
jgi:hypothetical protein